VAARRRCDPGSSIASAVVGEARTSHIPMSAAVCSATRQMKPSKTSQPTRPTAKRPARPLSRTQIARMLSNRYYVGKVVYGGAEHDGRHEALIDGDTFSRVQAVLSAHAQAGEKDRKHHHYLKGTVYCGYCGSRLTYARGTSKTGRHYWYFACVGRITGTGCRLPYLPAHDLEAKVAEHWATRVQLTADEVARIRRSLDKAFAGMRSESKREVRRQRARIDKLRAERDKLLQAFYADAIPVEQLKSEQDRVAHDLAQAEQLLALAEHGITDVQEITDQALDLVANCAATRKGRRAHRQPHRIIPSERSARRARPNVTPWTRERVVLNRRRGARDLAERGPGRGDGARGRVRAHGLPAEASADPRRARGVPGPRRPSPPVLVFDRCGRPQRRLAGPRSGRRPGSALRARATLLAGRRGSLLREVGGRRATARVVSSSGPAGSSRPRANPSASSECA
jgi:hypothetical protein